jgi:two-component system chemotaxis sensor kinase CheA
VNEDQELRLALIAGFADEAPELLAELVRQRDAWVENPDDTAAALALAAVLRTVRQRAGFLEFESLYQLALALESALGRQTAGTAPTDPATVDAAVAGVCAGVEQLSRGDDRPLAIDRLLVGLEPAVMAVDLSPEAQVARLGDDPTDDEPLPDLDEDDFGAGLLGDDGDDPAAAAAGAGAPFWREEDDFGSGPRGGSDDESGAAEGAAAAAEALAGSGGDEEEAPVQTGPISAEVAEFVPDFLTESAEILAKLDADLVRLEEASTDLDLLNEIFRAAHTLKGTSAFLGFTQMADVTHRMENVLDRLRKGEMQVHPGIMDVILAGVDQIKVLRDDIAANAIVRRDIAAVRQRLLAVAAGEPSPPVAAPTPGRPTDPGPPTAPLPKAATAAPAPEPTSARAAASHEADPVIRVDVQRIDKIMTLAEELVLGRNRLLQLNAQLLTAHRESELVNRLNEATSQVGMLTGELQESVMKMRMLPVARVFARFPRLVRDLARDLGKEIDLVVEDNDTEIDKSVADEIGDPLVHLVRNAVDHGVEAPDRRRAAGKNARGRVLLAAAHEGNHIVIRVEDDGGGMDPDRLRQKAVEKGLRSAAEVARMPDEDAFGLIFLPGFSTADKVTGVSGRGVGMDVVRTNITRLNGTIEVRSELGQGTRIQIRLPLTLAIITGLQVRVGDEIFIVPLSAVVEALKVADGEVRPLQGRKVIVARDRVLPVIDLGALLQVPAAAVAPRDRYVVLAGLAERRFGLLVDQLLGQVDVVIKALGEYVGPATGIAGATILGDGRVRLILDLGQLNELAEAAVGADAGDGRPWPAG